MCGIKFWKGNENLRSVYKKQFFEILSGFFLFSQKGFNVPSKNRNFSLMNRSNGVSKNSAFFGIDFRNVHVTLVKSAQKKFYFIQKTISPIVNLMSKKIFWGGQNFFWVYFLLRSFVHF